MTFKLTEKDIAAIEALISDFTGGLTMDEVASKHGSGHVATVRAFVGQLRKMGATIADRPKGIRPGTKQSEERRAKVSATMTARWAALREFEAREAAR